MKRPPRDGRLWAGLALLALWACSPAVEGRVRDRESGAPIPGAYVFQVFRAGLAGTEPAIVEARRTEADRKGRFLFDSRVAASPRWWLLGGRAPRYDFYHPDYGLVRGPTTDQRRVDLEGSRRDAAQRRGDLLALCQSASDDPLTRHLREIACPERPEP